MSRKTANRMVLNFLTPNKLKEILLLFDLVINIIRLMLPELPEFNLGGPLRITDVNQER